jgi:hypothetical protein
MSDRYPIGSVARVYLNLVGPSGAGLVRQSPSAAVWRRTDGQWLNAVTGVFQSAYVDNPMVELDAGHLAGRYYFDFDHALDLLVSSDFIVKKSSAGPPLVLSYGDLSFGAMPSVSDPRLCSVQGAIFGADGRRLAGKLVQATLIPVLTDALGRGYEADAPLEAYSGADGSFDLVVVRGATVRLEIPAVGYDRRALIPDQPSVLFSEL